MNKLKKLWQSAVFRWFVYVTPLLVFADLVSEDLDRKMGFYDNTTAVNIIWVLLLTLPALWVWRKPIWKAIGFLNKKADE